MKAKLLIFISVLLLASCIPSKEIRRANKFARKTERLKEKFPEFVRKDTVEAEVNYLKPRTVLNTRFVPKDIPYRDTLFFQNKDAKKWVWMSGDTIHSLVICDTLTITETVRIPCETLAPIRYVDKELKWWQQVLMFLGGLFLALIAIRLTFPKFF
jgi:hypothetical protein